MTKKLSLSILIILINTLNLFSQIIKVENGISMTSFQFKSYESPFDKKIYTYQISSGIDYLDKGWFNLSSNVGYIRRGGKSIYESRNNDGDYLGKIADKIHIDYLTLNTTFNVKTTTYNNYTFFAGVGPRLDFKLNRNYTFGGSPSLDISTAPKVNNIAFGLKCTTGAYYEVGRIQLGLNLSYLPNFTKIFKKDDGSGSYCHDHTFTLGLSLGYKLNE